MTAFFFSVVCLCLYSEILQVMSTPPEAFAEALNYVTVTMSGLVFIYGYNAVSACRAPMNSLINGSGNYLANFMTDLLDGLILRIGLAVLFGLGLNLRHWGFWLGDALAGFMPLIIGGCLYFSGRRKKIPTP